MQCKGGDRVGGTSGENEARGGGHGDLVESQVKQKRYRVMVGGKDTVVGVGRCGYKTAAPSRGGITQ